MNYVIEQLDEIEPAECPCGTTRRAVGNMRIINIPVPAFDPGDEWFDE